MTDVRILGRFAAAENVEALDQSQGRLILCSRDWARGGFVSAETDVVVKGPIYTAYPAENCFDGNRNSLMVVHEAAQWVRLTIDTGTIERKALLFIEYPEDEFVEPSEVELGNEAGDWHSVFADITLLYRGRRYGLWSLPISTVTESHKCVVKKFLSPVDYLVDFEEVEVEVSSGIFFPQTGVNAGLQRRVVSVNVESVVRLDRPFPVVLIEGMQVLIQTIPQSYLASQFVRLKLKRAYHTSGVPLRVAGVSLFDYYLELKGDKGNFRRVRAANPSGAEHEVHHGVLHRGLNSVRVQQMGGPKEIIRYEWQIACEGWPLDLAGWVDRGMVGLVDETHCYRQGFVQSPYSYRRLPIDNQGRSEVGASLAFEEV